MPRRWHAAIPSRVRAGARRPSRSAIAAVAYHRRRNTGGNEVAERAPGVLVGWRRRAPVLTLAVTGAVYLALAVGVLAVLVVASPVGLLALIGITALTAVYLPRHRHLAQTGSASGRARGSQPLEISLVAR